MTDWWFDEQTEEYQRVWRLLSQDGKKPELDYNELIYTIVDLSRSVAKNFIAGRGNEC